MDSSAGGGGVEPARSLEIAARLLAARDLVGCKRFAEHAVDADPLLPGADELLAVADVHLAAQRLLPSGRPDPLAILQLQPNPDSADVKRAFRRLANLLAPRRNPHPGADTALRAVEEAFAHLSESTSTGAAPAPAAPGGASAAEDTFWTVCPHCCHVHQYERLLVGRSLMCASAGCRRPFVATELPAAPPIVPGTDFYYCAWGFIPMGFPKPADLCTDWKPFFPMPRDSSAPQPASQPAPTDNFGKQNVGNNVGVGHTNANAPPSNAHPGNKSAGGGTVAGPPRGKIKKTAARKKVGGGLKKHASGGVESGIEPSLLGPDWSENAEGGHTENSRGININEVAKATDDSMMLHFGADGDIGFDLDVDASDDIMENLPDLPFLREDDNSRRMF
ncbi:unnamed protein product [Triticum aestivum]|uniref:J domain-containing protein n=4 Tax=Triticinae TaxID=1648030 RepID=A0A1D5V018_WHEAT|nr:uncharacterized protein LOC109759706 [Aegilops tauschii subsp. strangulata]XP_040257751.1 uncharacterized protein LOC109759706 [Aegilops tauschii subsp. strangulata]XP_044331044.1 uncharacterized protein LOC123052057 [Triticum aestivum]XP_044331045.1 uncharacterized protein LOC123052057 [Triticum aestivum]SPT16933.1 unnamed protein product [Triticum aestivum]